MAPIDDGHSLWLAIALIYHVSMCGGYSVSVGQRSSLLANHESQYWKAIFPNEEENGGDPASRRRLRQFASDMWTSEILRKDLNLSDILLPGQECQIPYPFDDHDHDEAEPFHDPTSFDWHSRVKVDAILQEFECYTNDSKETRDSWSSSKTSLCQTTAGFSKLALLDERGTPTNEALRYFPSTIQNLKRYFGETLAPRPVNINCQYANTGLSSHSDNMNFVWTVHLGLQVPSNGDCVFRMPTETQKWKRGEWIVADTSFVHSTCNPSPDEDRYILCFSIWHPALTKLECRGIIRVHDEIQKTMIHLQDEAR